MAKKLFPNADETLLSSLDDTQVNIPAFEASSPSPFDFTLTTDQLDYAPDSTATFTVSGAPTHGTIEYQLAVITGLGGDGIAGTSDDVLGATQTWFVTDGVIDTSLGVDGVLGKAGNTVAADADGTVDGTVTSNFYIDPALYTNQTMLLSATQVKMSGEGSFVAVGPTATQLITDAPPPPPPPPGPTDTGAIIQDLSVAGNPDVLIDLGGGHIAKISLDVVDINGAGTGQISPFVRVEATPQEQGYNTNANLLLLDNSAKGSSQWNFALSLSDVPIKIINGVAYREFFLDINEPNNTDNLISLDALQIWQSTSDILSNYAPGTSPDAGTGGFSSGANLRFDMDGAATGPGDTGDIFIALNGDLQAGSGNTVDLKVLVPTSVFNTDPWIYVYSAFGYQGDNYQGTGTSYTSDSGFEEWVTLTGAIISGHKFYDLNADGAWQSGEALLSGWTIYIDSNSNNTLDVGELSTVTDANGFYQFNIDPGLTTETFRIKEVQQTGWFESTPANNLFTVTVSLGQTSANNNFGNYQSASISGHKFEDLNGNGVNNSDPAVSGWTISLYKDDNHNNAIDSGEFVGSTTTDSNGFYQFTGLQPGDYLIQEASQTGWVNTTPVAINLNSVTSGAAIGNEDFLNYRVASISGHKFQDLNGNGVNNNDPGVSGWTITLYHDVNNNNAVDGGDTIAGTTTTDANGFYQFTGMAPGNYLIQEESRSGWVNTTAVVLDPASGGVTSGAAIGNEDFLNYQVASISGHKFEDLNGNGINNSDPAVSGWTITLYNDVNNNNAVDGGDTVAGTTTTAANGFYQFTGLAPGNYLVREESRTGWVNTTAVVLDPASGGVTSGAAIGNEDFLNYRVSSISGHKFEDLNGNGINNNDPAVSGWTITLYNDVNNSNTIDGGDTIAGTTTTAANGFYQFTGLAPGNYLLQEESRTGWVNTTAVVLDPGAVTSGSTIGNEDFLNVRVASISGHKFEDLNGNGINNSDPAVSGWTITLYNDVNNSNTIDGGDTVAGTTTTDANGFYQFTGLAPGNYLVREESRSGWVNTTAVVLDPGAVTSGAAIGNEDFLNYQVSSISGHKFEDLNGNGINNSDPAVSGWTITLYNDVNNSNTVDGGDTIAGTTTTDGNGFYQFTGLAPGNYLVQEESRTGWVNTTAVVLDPGAVTSGAAIGNEDFLNYQVSSISGHKFEDLNGNGINDSDPAVSGWTITLYRDNNNDGAVDGGDTNLGTTTTDGNGFYQFTGLAPGNYVIQEESRSGWTNTTAVVLDPGVVTSGSTIGNEDFLNYQVASISGHKFEDLNGNGINNNDPAVSGWTITLYQDNNNDGAVDGGDTNLGTTTTDANGFYQFTGMAPGNYLVQEESRSGWVNTTAVVLDPGAVTSGAAIGNEDFLNYQVSSISGHKFEDLNGNGINNSDPAVSGWTITLYNDVNDNNAVDGGDTIAGTTTTDANGFYQFTGLAPGNYLLQEESRTGWVNTTAVVLDPGAVTSGAAIGNEDFLNYQLASISGHKYDDLNGNGINDSDPAVSGWTITLYNDVNNSNTIDGGDTIAGTTTTDGNGFYQFTGLAPGDYLIQEGSETGWVNTTAVVLDPASGGVTSGADIGNQDFLNWQPPTGQGVRTPGFWRQNDDKNGKWVLFWDGIVGNEPQQAGTDCFPAGELTYAVDSNHDGVVDGSDTKGLLVGDFNHDGIQDNGEHTFYISISDALTLLQASDKQVHDGRFMLGRDLIATWLNDLNGTNVGSVGNAGDPAHYIDDAVQWMIQFGNTNTAGDTANGVTLTTSEFTQPTKVLTNSTQWTQPQNPPDLSGSALHSGLDEYNNKGTINTVFYAPVC